jgi:molecular chaperone DnaJ
MDGKVSMKIPDGTQSGKIYRLRGKGIPSLHGYGRGDETGHHQGGDPHQPYKRQKELLEEFAQNSNESSHPMKKGFLDKSWTSSADKALTS